MRHGQALPVRSMHGIHLQVAWRHNDGNTDGYYSGGVAVVTLHVFSVRCVVGGMMTTVAVLAVVGVFVVVSGGGGWLLLVVWWVAVILANQMIFCTAVVYIVGWQMEWC